MARSLFAWTSVFILGVGVAAVACSSDEGGSDPATGGAGGSGGNSTGGASSCGPTPLGFSGECKPGAPEQCCGSTIPVMKYRDKNDKLVDPDWSCITGSGGAGGSAGSGGGGGVSPDAGADSGAADSGADAGADAAADAAPPTTQNIFEVEDFSSGNAVVDIEVELYEGEAIVDKTPFHTAFTKGPINSGNPGLNNGQFYFPHPSSKYISYRVKEKPGIAKEFVGFGEEVPAAPGKVVGNTLSPDLYLQLSTFVVPLPGWTPPDDLAIITGPVRDCAGNDVGGARVRYFDVDGGKEVEPGSCERDIRYVYFDAQYPNPKCAYTDYRQSLWVIANAPGNAAGPNKGHKYRIEYWGRLKETDTEPVKFAEKQIEVFSKTVNVHQIRPNIQQ